ncbi:hypothetical protein [Alicyclobacillus sp. SO9]|uniref:hypothetical protein n=1 Tax=Alicyclobacillus sp. SO9 TaxID=2665646 RepID=UPI0018E840B0|nr:hypothetical protein [Alicyclobacillus sp. SO9]QQE80927.1 hypothetical protein GI364_11380 [Alicyclobacillus sp. SO9]
MARKYFHEQLAQSPETKSHMTVMEDVDKPVHLPIVNGVVSIPDQLHDKVVMGPKWVPYTGQVPANPEELSPLDAKQLAAHYKGAEKSK